MADEKHLSEGFKAQQFKPRSQETGQNPNSNITNQSLSEGAALAALGVAARAEVDARNTAARAEPTPMHQKAVIPEPSRVYVRALRGFYPKDWTRDPEIARRKVWKDEHYWIDEDEAEYFGSRGVTASSSKKAFDQWMKDKEIITEKEALKARLAALGG